MTAGLDLDRHADEATRAFSIVRSSYVLLAEQVHRIFDHSFSNMEGLTVHKIEQRAKDLESFRAKCRKTVKNGDKKYTDPLNQITDLAGVRVILFFPNDIKKVCDFIDQNFLVKERTDLGEERYAASGIFGYQSIHYLVYLQANRTSLPEFKQSANMICEIQVRTILQHAWAEMEHDIQYKSLESHPAEIKRKFTALAGMLEIADREFQSIQHEDEKLRNAIKKSLEEQLTRERIAESQKPHEETPQAEAAPAPKALGARQLVIQGRFAEAVDAYSKQIEIQPTAHTLYLGRAKARFLAGDRAGALADIEQASAYNSEDPTIKVTLEQIESGNVTKIPSDADRSSQFMKLGHEALSRGHGEAAFEHYTDAQNSGYNHLRSVFFMSMACTLGLDAEGARRFASELNPPAGTPMSVNHLALICIIHCVENKRADWPLDEVKKQIASLDNYSYEISPIRYLESGFNANMNTPDGMQDVINALKNK